ncbi:hypothetical protein F4780DRAFT_781718 [Xylariomycetidae sp. FL0641]|nr:hypothetical protein F4780DRAFT_781718 [Xylariomycetidae sp. FL0641]
MARTSTRTRSSPRVASPPTVSARKRKLPGSWQDTTVPRHRTKHAKAEAQAEPTTNAEAEPSKTKKKKAAATDEEKRLKKFRPKAPQSFAVIYHRATSQRFFVLGRKRAGTPDCPEEFVEMTGTTGNIYVVHIAKVPSCTCPHAQKGNQCKHILYVMSRVLRARFEFVYQRALLSGELEEIFQHAPPIDIDNAEDKNRKAIEGDCPICFTPFENNEKTVYCRATCGQNIHKKCFEMWAATKRKSGSDHVTCPICRSPWQGDEDTIKKIQKTGIAGPDGYINVADQLGISGRRDWSTYYQGPRRRGQRSIRWR